MASSPDLSQVLERLGLASYFDALTDHGFHDWETVLDITEDDLASLGFKLGHRRILQREIATFRGLPPTESLEPSNPALDPSATSPSASTPTPQTSPPPREKRRYRRHPRPDPNAPKKPKTAYVNFADALRTHPEFSTLSFVDIAKEVGRRWQVLPPEQKRVWESHAARAMQEYELLMDEYKKTDSWRAYQAYLSDFKAQQIQAAKAKRPSAHRIDSFVRGASSRASPASSESPAPLPPSNAPSVTEAESCHNALTLAFSELVSLRGEVLVHGAIPYDMHHLPPEQLTRRAMHAFVQGTGSFLYMWTYGQVDEILDRVYRPVVQVDAMTLAECFTVAAMGAHYDAECFSDHVRQVLYASATLHFHERTASLDYLRTARLLLSMSFYALLEKHMSARYLVAAGLQIARWKCPPSRPDNHSNQDTPSDSWRKLFQSLIFMDCWLSCTLGYIPAFRSEDIAAACTTSKLDRATIDEIVHTQTSKIGLISAEIVKTLASPDLATRENIETLAGKLEHWRKGVPPALQIAALTSTTTPSTLTLYQRRAIMMVHIMYLGALILLYRRPLVATAGVRLDADTHWDMEFTPEDAKRYRNECAVAGQQVAHILHLISIDGSTSRRCWLLIYWSFAAAIVLLFSATTKLVDGLHTSAEQDLSFARTCLDMLERSREDEAIARRYLDLLTPLHRSLREVHQRVVGKVKTSIFSLLRRADEEEEKDKESGMGVRVKREEVSGHLEKLCGLLMDPFGRKFVSEEGREEWEGRKVVDKDGKEELFWWR
ncbi:uncharacterized protein EI97DRAFT_224084 [Westerdykella ornata]|uniref:HMG box domain-containing protein n=1 Tax=Westerdykella ornata TaxID=318751 RepID=A0A6A6JSV8_WESOR|nr:uncharacterized protein EI97DRAFT_224084 [Westerdykella ornata]KAF2278948.1 hypothetical protein EI97DRAFT_224084 [Westerdykella ornata]